MPLYRNSDTVVIPGASGAAVAHTGDTAETTLATITIPAGLMGANGQVVIDALISHTNSANNKTFRIKFGGSTISSSTVTTSGATRLSHKIDNRNSQSSQVHFSQTSTTSGGAPSTLTKDTSAAVDVTFTGQLALGTETITLESYSVRVFPKA